MPIYKIQKPSTPQGVLYNTGLGLRSCRFFKMGSGEVLIPANTTIHVVFIIQGTGAYDNIPVKAGDILAFGLNRQPIKGFSNHLQLFVLDMDYFLFYRMEGFIPYEGDNIIKLDNSCRFAHMYGILRQFPREYWIQTVDRYLHKTLVQEIGTVPAKLERVYQASNHILLNGGGLKSAADGIGLSFRQLQRDFKTVLGMSPKDYERISRFHSAVMHLREENEVHAALKAGYYDQSHMCKEFREFSVWTPSRIQDFMNTFINIAG